MHASDTACIARSLQKRNPASTILQIFHCMLVVHYTVFLVFNSASAAMQPMQSKTSHPTAILSNCQYNIVKQLEKKTQLLWSIDGYIQDAEAEGNPKCAEVFRQIKADEERHAKMLKELLTSFPGRKN